MLPENRISTHPGEVLREEFLVPMGLSAADLAKHISRPAEEIETVTAGRGPVTAELAWLLSMAFNTTPEFWLNLQSSHDLTRSRPDHRVPVLSAS